jgi:hypothetical protein
MLSLGQRKRISRIRRRASPAVREAFKRGQISVRRADTLLYLEPPEQEARLAEFLAGRDTKVRAYQRAAGIINAYLQERRSPKRIDLHELECRIREALAHSVP